MIDSSEEMERRIDEIVADLRTAGLIEAAQRLAHIQGSASTTGSEWRRELTRTVRSIRQTPGCPRALRSKLGCLLAPGFSERVICRQLWQAIRTGVILLMFGAAAVALATADDVERFAPLWTAAAVALVALLWLATHRSSVCPGCGTRIRQRSPHWCPYCATDLVSGVTGPRVAILPTTPCSRLLTCRGCGQPPGGRGRYGAQLPSEGHFCSSCGARLPDE